MTSALKALAFVALAAAAFALGGQTTLAGRVLTPPAGLTLVAAFVLSLQAVIYTYDGWFGDDLLLRGESRTPAGTFLDRFRRRAGSSSPSICSSTWRCCRCCRWRTGWEIRRGRRGRCDLRRLGRPGLQGSRHRLDAERHQLQSPHGQPGALCHEPRRPRTRRAAVVNEGGTPTMACSSARSVAMLFIVFGRTFERVITVLASSSSPTTRCRSRRCSCCDGANRIKRGRTGRGATRGRRRWRCWGRSRSWPARSRAIRRTASWPCWCSSRAIPFSGHAFADTAR